MANNQQFEQANVERRLLNRGTKMNLVRFLQELSAQGVKFWIEGDKIRTGGTQEVLTPAIIGQLKQHKASIVQLLKEQPEIFHTHPLSPGQKALWFLWELAPESGAYNQVFTTRICDTINIDNLHLALQQLVKRHQSLSSTFPKPGEEPIQQINQHEKINFQQVDASTWNQAELQTKVYQESQRPFNLEQEKVMRVRLYTSSPTEHILLLTIHHIATDGWSLDIIISELAELYQAQQQGTTPSLPIIKYTYFDYVRSQQQMLAGTEGEKLWQYWQKQLQGELPVINLPTDKPRPPIQTYKRTIPPTRTSTAICRL